MPKNPHANFRPTLESYSGQGAFRFWCQMALPLTYDNSLSYYELLNKVVTYLNNTIEDVGKVEDNVAALNEAYGKLEDYVNTYFDEIDIEAELRNVLDAMAEDGSLDSLLDPLVAARLGDVVAEQISGVVANQIDGAVSEQIDGAVLENLPAVVPDAVNDWLDNNVTPTTPIVDKTLTISGAAADAKVTGDKIADLKNALNIVNSSNLLNELDTSNGYLTRNGTLSVTGDWKTTDFIDVSNISSVVGSRTKDDGTRGPIGFGYLCTYGADKTTVVNYYSNNQNVYTVEEGVQYIRISYHGSFREPMISVGTTVPTVYEPYGDYSKLVTSPESFGAIGDGVSDDTLTIQYAIDSGAKYIVANGVYNVSTIYIDNEINFIFNEIKGNLVIKGYRNIIAGKKLSGSAPLVIGYESNTASGNIIQIGYIYCSGYTTGDCILLDGTTASVMNNLFINCQTNRGAYGFHMIANTGFCNQNVMLMCVSTNAAQYGMFAENLATGTDAGSKMNGGRYYNYDPETSAGAVKMSGRCEDHKFYGLRTREFGNRAICFSFDANVRGITFDNGFKYGQVQFVGDETTDAYQSIKCEGMSSDTGGSIFTGSCEITGANNAVIIYPKTEQKLKLINITENTDFSYYTSNKNVSFNVFRNSNSTTTGVQATAVLRGCFGYGKIDKVYSFANTGEIPPRITAGGKYYAPPATPVSEPTLFEFDMIAPELTFMKTHKGTLIQQ